VIKKQDDEGQWRWKQPLQQNDYHQKTNVTIAPFLIMWCACVGVCKMFVYPPNWLSCTHLSYSCICNMKEFTRFNIQIGHRFKSISCY
jgi:hypothetical protein